MKRKIAATGMAAAVLTGCGGGGIDEQPVAQPKPALRANAFTSVQTFPGLRSRYAIVRTAAGFTVTDRTGATSPATVSGTQALRFDDITINLTVGDKSKTMAAADLKLLMELYVAFFNRIPDADGLEYWIGRFNEGMSVNQIAESFYAAAIEYSTLTGYSSAMGNSDFVRLVYKNVLGRYGDTAPPPEDVQYWANRMGKSGLPKGELVRTMLDSAHSFAGHATWGWVPQLLDNKYQVAAYSALQQGVNFNSPQESISKMGHITSMVTSTDTEEAKSMIGFSDPGFNLLQ